MSCIQRQFIDPVPSCHTHETDRRRVVVYTVARNIWVVVARSLLDDDPIAVLAANNDATPWGDNRVERVVTLREFPNTDDGWDEANNYAGDVLIVFGLLDRADTRIDHHIAASHAVLADARAQRVA